MHEKKKGFNACKSLGQITSESYPNIANSYLIIPLSAPKSLPEREDQLPIRFFIKIKILSVSRASRCILRLGGVWDASIGSRIQNKYCFGIWSCSEHGCAYHFFSPTSHQYHQDSFILFKKIVSHRPLLVSSLVPTASPHQILYKQALEVPRTVCQVKGQNSTDLRSMHFLCLHGYGTNGEVQLLQLQAFQPCFHYL